MLNQSGDVAVLDWSLVDEGACVSAIVVGVVAMGSDGAVGEVEHVEGDLVILRLFEDDDGRAPATAGYSRAEVTAIREPIVAPLTAVRNGGSWSSMVTSSAVESLSWVLKALASV